MCMFRWYLSLTTRISFYKLRISGLISVCVFSPLSSSSSTPSRSLHLSSSAAWFVNVFCHFLNSSCLSCCSFCHAVTIFMRFAVDYRRLSNLDAKYVIEPKPNGTYYTHFTLIDQYIGKFKWERATLSLSSPIHRCSHSVTTLQPPLLSFIMIRSSTFGIFPAMWKGNHTIILKHDNERHSHSTLAPRAIFKVLKVS